MNTQEILRELQALIESDVEKAHLTGRVVVTIDCRNGGMGKCSLTVTHEFFKKELTSTEK
jgi:hypothetical protein